MPFNPKKFAEEDEPISDFDVKAFLAEEDEKPSEVLGNMSPEERESWEDAVAPARDFGLMGPSEMANYGAVLGQNAYEALGGKRKFAGQAVPWEKARAQDAEGSKAALATMLGGGLLYRLAAPGMAAAEASAMFGSGAPEVFSSEMLASPAARGLLSHAAEGAGHAASRFGAAGLTAAKTGLTATGRGAAKYGAGLLKHAIAPAGGYYLLKKFLD